MRYSNDPWVQALRITNGSFTFGLSLAVRLSAGLALVVVGGILVGIPCFVAAACASKNCGNSRGRDVSFSTSSRNLAPATVTTMPTAVAVGAGAPYSHMPGAAAYAPVPAYPGYAAPAAGGGYPAGGGYAAPPAYTVPAPPPQGGYAQGQGYGYAPPVAGGQLPSNPYA